MPCPVQDRVKALKTMKIKERFYMSLLIRPFIIKCMLIKVPTSCVVDSVHGNAHLAKIANSSLMSIAR